jgi:hypothetical protein
VTRREVLRAAGLTGLAGLAGCNQSEASPPDSSPTGLQPDEDSVFQSLSFDVGDLVIGLPEDHGVSRISLTAPDGTLFQSVRPDFAETTVRLPVADPEIGQTDYVHYTPGTHELVAKVGERTERQSIELRPDLSIVDIDLYRDGDRPIDDGRLVVRIRNDGTAPTWPYDITFVNAPNWGADEPISRLVGLPKVGSGERGKVMIPPMGERDYVTPSTPLLYDKESGITCSGEKSQFSVIIAAAAEPPLKQKVRVTALGNRENATIYEQYVCTDSELEVVDG